MHISLRHPVTKHKSHGILTLCPSSTAFAIPLGPTNPWLIDITEETLIFRRGAFSTPLRLLVPTFLLPHAPEALTGPPSSLYPAISGGESGTLSYHALHHTVQGILKFGNILSPNYFRCKISR